MPHLGIAGVGLSEFMKSSCPGAKLNALVHCLLLRNWSNPTRDLGSCVFLFGKAIGIDGRVLGLLFMVAAVAGSLASATVLLFVAYGGGLAAMAALVIEVCARLLMVAGNAVSAHRRLSGNLNASLNARTDWLF